MQLRESSLEDIDQPARCGVGFAGQLVDHLVFGVDVVEGLANLDENAILIAGKVAAVDAGHPAFAVVGLASQPLKVNSMRSLVWVNSSSKVRRLIAMRSISSKFSRICHAFIILNSS